jgi:hypothetical protein
MLYWRMDQRISPCILEPQPSSSPLKGPSLGSAVNPFVFMTFLVIEMCTRSSPYVLESRLDSKVIALANLANNGTTTSPGCGRIVRLGNVLVLVLLYYYPW